MVQYLALTERSSAIGVPDAVLDLETVVVPHTHHTDALDAIRSLHGRFRPPSAPRRLKARALLIVGESGAGKTTILEDYASAFPARLLAEAQKRPRGASQADRKALQDGDIRRVLSVEAAKGTTQRALVAAILGACGSHARDHWNADDIIGRIKHYVTELGTELILIDEAHHLVVQRSQEATEDVTEFLKSLLNRVKVQIVLAGLPSLLKLTKHRQLKRRIHDAVVLTPYNWSTRRGRTHFCGLLGVFESIMRLPAPSDLRRHDVAKRLYVASLGEIGFVSKYLSRALELAVKRDLPSIGLELLAEVDRGFHPAYPDNGPLDFDAILEDDDHVSAANDNPFECPDHRLKIIWEERRGANAAVAGHSGDSPTRLRGLGRAVASPLIRR